MGFSKAKSEQAFIKMSMYGKPGSGKTFSALLFAEGLARHSGKRIAYVDTEHGSDFYALAIKERRVHPEAFDFDALYTRSLAQVLRDVTALDTKVHGVVVIDSITHMWEAAMDAYKGPTTSQGGIPLQAWGDIKRPYKQLMNFLVAMPAHVLILGREKNIFEKDENDSLTKVGVGIKAEGDTQYDPHICVHLECRPSTSDQTQSAVYMLCEKDRSSVLQGRTLTNPNFDTIKPVLDVLVSKTQAAAEDQEQRIADDSAIVEEEAKAKSDKSKTLYAEMGAALAQADTLEALGVAVKAMKKSKKSMLEEHVEALRIALEDATKRINEKAVGAI